MRHQGREDLSPEAWAEQVFGNTPLGDLRRTRRLVKAASTLAKKPMSSFSGAYKSWGEAKGAYRLIENEAVTREALLESLARDAAESSRDVGVVLAVSDTTGLNFTTHRATSGLGNLGVAGAEGLWVHSTILLDLAGTPLGLAWQEVWARIAEEHGKRHCCKEKPIEEKESMRWIKSIRCPAKYLDELPYEDRPYVIHVFDREGDIHEVFEAVSEMEKEGMVIRSARNRRMKSGQEHVHEAARSAPVIGHECIEVPRRPNEPKRMAQMEFRACQAVLTPDPKKHPKRKEVTVNVVAAREVNADESVKEPLEWILLTTEPVGTLAEVREVVRIYKMRWRIEEYHLILKSGCRIEEVQFETAERIGKVLTLLCGVALRLLRLTYLARVDETQPCTAVLSDTEWRALQTRIEERPPSPDASPPTLRQAVMWIGRLGGHLGRKGDGMPGVRALWRGWRDLQIITVMYIAFHAQNEAR